MIDQKVKNKIKILHVILDLDCDGGTEKILVDVVNGLSREEFESSIICLDRYGDRASKVRKDVTLYLMGRNPGINLKNFYSFYRLFKEIKPDIVHFRNFTTYFWGCIVSRYQKNIRVIYSDHSEIVHNYEQNEKGKLFARRILKHFTDNFMTNSLTFKEKLIEYVRLDPKNVVVIQNGVDTENIFPLDLNEKQSLRVKFGFSEQDYIIGIIAGFRPKKNISLAIKAMNELTHKIPSAKLVLVGEGEQEKELKTLTQNLGLLNNVHFLGLTKEINKVLNIFDLFLFPSSYGEGMPNAVLEAMAVKVPIVASDIPGNIELLQDSQRGIFFRNNDKDSLVKAVLRISNDKELSNKIVEKAYHYVREAMSLHRMIRNYEKFYRAVQNQQHIDI